MRRLRRTWLVIALSALACKQGPPAPEKGDALAGSWQRTLLTHDANANDALDPEERKPWGPSYGYTGLAFDAGGKCRLEKGEQKLTGACGTMQKDGARWITIEPEGDLQSRYLILVATEKELVLKDGKGNKGTIYVYEPRP
jgi:hypothetical protein